MPEGLSLGLAVAVRTAVVVAAVGAAVFVAAVGAAAVAEAVVAAVGSSKEKFGSSRHLMPGPASIEPFIIKNYFILIPSCKDIIVLNVFFKFHNGGIMIFR